MEQLDLDVLKPFIPLVQNLLRSETKIILEEQSKILVALELLEQKMIDLEQKFDAMVSYINESQGA
ncbi:MAG: hypothetical protein ACTSWW_13500 [Promethearchaeota archaeon]